MENPEVAVEILGWLRNAGASLALWMILAPAIPAFQLSAPVPV